MSNDGPNFINTEPNYGAQGIFHAPVQIIQGLSAEERCRATGTLARALRGAKADVADVQVALGAVVAQKLKTLTGTVWALVEECQALKERLAELEEKRR